METSGTGHFEAHRALMRTTKRLRRFVSEIHREAGLSPPQFWTLIRIPKEGIPMSQLAAASWLDPGNVTGIVDRLERDGWVERSRSRADRRVVLVAPTDKTTEGLPRIIDLTRKRVEMVWEILSDSDLDQLQRTLLQLEERLETLTNPDGEEGTEE